jgi:hypothetical protein
MNRRGFLKFLPAAVIGGKQAAAEAAEKLALGAGPIGGLGLMDAAGSLSGGSYTANYIGSSVQNTDWAINDLRRLLDPAWLAERRDEIRVQALDPDLASMKSMSLGVRMQIQKDRLLARYVERERTRLEKIIAGVFD